MTIDILVPDLPESVTDATIATWHKKPGEQVARDEVLVEVETDKVVLEIPAPQAGVLEQIIEDTGAVVQSKQLIAKLVAGTAKDAEPVAAEQSAATATQTENAQAVALTPSARRELAQYQLSPSDVKGSGVGGRITREDVRAYLEEKHNKPEEAAVPEHLAIAAENDIAGAPKERRVAMTRLRKRVAER
ncbi:MAG: biotin/lipoyl-containing protein, partial [Vibrionaceae bacterium]